jgi:RNA polymerase sigma-70 factor (ECF subfamily)
MRTSRRNRTKGRTRTSRIENIECQFVDTTRRFGYQSRGRDADLHRLQATNGAGGRGSFLVDAGDRGWKAMALMEPAGQSANAHHVDFAAQLAAAQCGDLATLGRVLEVFRPYLLTIANQHLPKRLWSKCGGSDLVQDTLLEAHRGFAGFEGGRPEDLRAWLGGILRHNLKDSVRRFASAERRSVHREQSLHTAAPGRFAAAALVDPDPTPGSSAANREEAAAIDAALEQLATDDRLAIILRNRDHLSWDEIGRRMNRSSDAARMVWKRAILHLQQILEPSSGSIPRVRLLDTDAARRRK